jgi:hypothetical protein
MVYRKEVAPPQHNSKIVDAGLALSTLLSFSIFISEAANNAVGASPPSLPDTAAYYGSALLTAGTLYWMLRGRLGKLFNDTKGAKRE